MKTVKRTGAERYAHYLQGRTDDQVRKAHRLAVHNQLKWEATHDSKSQWRSRVWALEREMIRRRMTLPGFLKASVKSVP